jgi:hypothetical protein
MRCIMIAPVTGRIRPLMGVGVGGQGSSPEK